MVNKWGRIYRTDKVKKISYCSHTMNGSLSDEIALRDEILELKKQLIILKKANEKNFIKFRKYEDEVKRKDREIEQLMDPRKNAEIAKVLSTKGAAILMNLKDQNNSLIQMVLNKDLQIKRLTAEIKMSKLYTATKKNGSQAQHALRLKNLLRQLQDSLKETAAASASCAQQLQDNSSAAFEFTSSSDQSSPRELNDLMLTLQSLETYIKYSNDLLAKKNQEISTLTEETKTLRKTLKYKEYKYRRQNLFSQSEQQELFSNKFLSKEETSFSLDNSRFKTISVKNLLSTEPIEKEQKLPHSAPTSSSRQLSEVFLDSKTTINEETLSKSQHPEKNDDVKENTYQTSNDVSSFSSTPVKTTNNLSNPIKTRCVKRNKIKEKWKKVWVKHKQLKKGNSVKKEEVKQNEKMHQNLIDNEVTQNISLGGEDLNISQEIIYKSKEGNEGNDKSNSPEYFNNNSSDAEVSENRESEKLYESDESRCLSVVKLEETQLDFTKDDDNEKEVNIFSDTSQHEETSKLINNLNLTNNQDGLASKSFDKVFHNSLDSSFESDNTPVKSVQVEVQINAVYNQELDDISSVEKSFEELTQNKVNGSDYDDDDDVVVK